MTMNNNKKEVKWNEMYEYAKRYYEHYGNLEVPVIFTTDNGMDYEKFGKIKLGQWIKAQRNLISPNSNRGKLLSDIGMRFEKRQLLSWEQSYECAKKYYEHYGNLNVPYKFRTNNGVDYDENGKVPLGSWLTFQRKNINFQSEKGKLLSDIGMTFQNRHSVNWQKNYSYAKKYFDCYGNLEVPISFKTNNGTDYEECGKIKLGEWIHNQRKITNPDSDRGKLLSDIGMRFENKRCIFPWEKWYDYAKKYYEHYGNLNVAHSFETDNGIDYVKGGRIKLGRWVTEQKKNIDPDSEQAKLLFDIGLTYKKRNTLRWEKMYHYAKKYYEYHGHLEMKSRFKTNNGYEHTENGKIHLGNWVSFQRKNVNPESDQGKMLSSIGMVFVKDKRFDYWNQMYQLAKKYYEYYGNLNIPFSFKTNNGIDYDEKGISLSSWVRYQAHNSNLDKEQIQKLASIGINFSLENNKDEWQENYEYAKKYYEHYGNLKVPVKFKTDDGVFYRENGKIPLGRWISNQRYTKNDYRRKLLSDIGMQFNNKSEDFVSKRKSSWLKNYELAKKYYEHYGNLKITHTFKTDNGVDFSEDGKISLGFWINHQRNNNSMSDEQRNLLSEIDMIWNVYENKKEISKLCLENHINKEINKNILNNMSSQGLQAKITFLQDNHIPLVDEYGKLHEVFSMNNEELFKKYGVRMKDVIRNHSSKVFEKKYSR